MTNIRLELSQREFVAGGLISGNVVIEKEYEHRFSSVRLILSAKETTRIGYYADGKPKFEDSSWTRGGFCKESIVHFTETYELQVVEMTIRGVERVPFSIEVPSGYPPSFSGEMSKVEYTLEAEILTSYSPLRSPKAIIIVRRLLPFKSKEIRKEEDGFSVNLATDTFCIGQSLKAEIKIPVATNIRGVKFEIINTEIARADTLSQTMTYVPVRGKLNKNQILDKEWVGIEFDLDDSNVLPSIRGHLFENKNELKITLDIPFALDTIISIPINLAYCQEQDGREVEFDELF